MSDISKLQLTVDSASALQNLNKVQTSLNKTESAANSLKNTLKSIGLSVGFTYLVKETLKLSNSTDALNKRFKQFFGTDGVNAVKDLTNNFTLANRQAKELLSTAAKFGTATGLRGKGLTSFSSELSKLAADIAGFYAIDDVNSVLERFGMATLGRTQGLREFGIQIETTSEYFKNLVREIQNTTGASEQQAKQLAILQEAQRQLAHTQGSAAEQINSGWQQLNNLFTNFKDILAEVGGVFSKIFAPILQGLNSVLSIPLTKTLIAWGIAIGTLTTITGFLVSKLKAISQIISKTASEFKDSTDNINTGLKGNTHEARRFEVAINEAYKAVNKLQRLQFVRNAYMVNPTKYVDQLKSINTQIAKTKGITEGSIQALDKAAKNVDFKSLELTKNMKKMFDDLIIMAGDLSAVYSTGKFPNLAKMLIQFSMLNNTTSKTTKSFVNLASILNTINPKINKFSVGLTSFLTADLGRGFSNIKTFFAGASGSLLALLTSLGAIVGKIGLVAILLEEIYVGFSDAWGAIVDEFHIGRSQLNKDAKELEEMFSKLDKSIFETTKMNYWDTRIEGLKRIFGSIFDFQTEKQKKEAELIEKYWEQEVSKAVNSTNQLWSNAQREISKFEANTKEQKLKFLQEELNAAKSALATIEARGKELQSKRGSQSNIDAIKREKELQETVKNWLQTKKNIKSINDEIAKLMEDNAKNTLKAAKFSSTQTAIQGVEAASMEALKLQSREFDVMPSINQTLIKFFDNFITYKDKATEYLRKLSVAKDVAKVENEALQIINVN